MFKIQNVAIFVGLAMFLMGGKFAFAGPSTYQAPKTEAKELPADNAPQGISTVGTVQLVDGKIASAAETASRKGVNYTPAKTQPHGAPAPVNVSANAMLDPQSQVVYVQPQSAMNNRQNAALDFRKTAASTYQGFEADMSAQDWYRLQMDQGDHDANNYRTVADANGQLMMNSANATAINRGSALNMVMGIKQVFGGGGNDSYQDQGFKLQEQQQKQQALQNFRQQNQNLLQILSNERQQSEILRQNKKQK